jgi:hypothetical protein
MKTKKRAFNPPRTKGTVDAELQTRPASRNHSAGCIGDGSVHVRKPTAGCVGVSGVGKSSAFRGSASDRGVADWDGDWACHWWCRVFGKEAEGENQICLTVMALGYFGHVHGSGSCSAKALKNLAKR